MTGLRRFTRRATALAGTLALMAVVAPAGAGHDPLPFNQVVEPGYVVAPYGQGTPGATSLTFGPDDNLYVSTVTGEVLRIPDLGGVGGPPEVVVSGLDTPLGITFDAAGTLYVSAIDPDNAADGRTWGMVIAIEDATTATPAAPEKLLVDLPNGRHNTNGLAFGPDGKLYVTNGNSTDDGVVGGDPEIPPLSGSVVRFDPTDASSGSLSALAYEGSGVTSEDPVEVVATGMRNLYDLAFRGSDLYVTTNGPDAQDPLGEDTLVRVEDAPNADLADGTAPNFGFPGCLYTHDDLGHPVAAPATTPNLPADEKTCDQDPPVTDPIAVFGMHPSTDGVAFAPEGFGPRGGDLFAAEFGNFFVDPVAGSGVAGHEVARVGIDAAGDVVENPDGSPDVADFMIGVVPLDLTFHGDAMYVAEFGTGTVLRVAPVPAP